MLFVLSCKTPDKKETYQSTTVDTTMALTSTYQGLKINDRTNNAIKEFIAASNCRACIYEIYVDKVRPDEVIIVLKSRTYSEEYLRTTNPLFTSMIDSVRFNIFCGLEDIFVGDKRNFNYSNYDSSKTVFKVWSLFVKPDSIRVEKDTGYPFFPAEPLKLKPKNK